MRKIISIFLVVVMLASMFSRGISNAFASETNEADLRMFYDISGDMTELGIGQGSGKSLDLIDYEYTNGFYRFFANTDSGNKQLGGCESVGDYCVFRSGTGGGTIMLDRSYVAFEVYIPKAGTYDMEMYCATNRWGAPVDVYMKKGEATTDESYKVGQYSSDDNNITDTKKFDIITTPRIVENIEIPEAGKYVFTFLEKSGDYGYVGGFALTSGNGEAMQMAVKLGQKARRQVALYAIMSDGSELEFEGAEIEYTSSDTAVAEVDKLSGVITEKTVGTTTIIAKTTLNGETVTSTMEYKVKAIGNPSEIKAVYRMNSGEGYDFAKEGVLPENVKYADTNGFWQWHSAGLSEEASFDVMGFVNVPSKVNEWVAFEVNIPKAGKYDVTLEHGSSKTAGASRAGMWIIPYDTGNISEALAEDDPSFAEISFCNKSQLADKVMATTEGSGYYFANPGKYLVVYKPLSGGGADGTSFEMYPGNIIFDGGEAVIPMHTGIGRKDRNTLTTTVVMSDGNAADLSDAEISYVSSDSSVAEINEEGVITEKAAGNTVFSVFVKGNGWEAEASLHHTVTDVLNELPYSGIKAVYGMYSGPGYEFARGVDWASEVTYEKTRNFWQWHSSSVDQSSGNRADFNPNYGIQIWAGVGDWAAIEINVPKAGKYKVNLEYGSSNSYGAKEAGIWILPGDTKDIPSALTNDTALTTSFAFMDDKQTSNLVCKNKDIGEYYFENAGRYIVVYKSISGSPVYPGKLTLDGGDGSVMLSADIKWRAGGADVVTLNSDGSEEVPFGASVKFKSSEPSVAEIDEATGDIMEKTIGETVISATVAFDDWSYTVSEVYSIKSEPKASEPPAETVVEYDFVNISSEWGMDKNPNQDAERDQDVRDITYEYTSVKGEGNWEWFGAGHTPGPLHVLAYVYAGADGRLSLYEKKDQWMGLTINVPKAGKYAAKLEYAVYNSGYGEAELYIFKKGTVADAAASLTPINLIGEVSFRNASASSLTIKEKNLSHVEFDEPGEYVLAFKATSAGTMAPRKLTLDGKNTLKSVAFRLADSRQARLNYKQEAETVFTAKKLDGTVLSEEDCDVIFTSSDSSIATVDSNGKITAIGDGTVTVTASASDGTGSYSASIKIQAVDNTGIAGAKLKVPTDIYVGGKAKTTFVAVMNSGNELKVAPNGISYTYSNPGIVSFDAEGMVIALSEGETEVTATGDFRGETISDTVVIRTSVHEGKKVSTYYTTEKRQAAEKNAQKYTWAKDTVKTAKEKAQIVVDNYEFLYELIPGEGIPRSRQIGAPGDPEYNMCRYCGENIVGKYGASGVGGWVINGITRPWKVQCPDCKRIFPSNDFELLRERGTDEHGYYNRELAIAENEKAVARGEKDALHNDLYPEVADSKTVNVGRGLRPGESAETWGVDDGWGYIPKDENGNPYKYGDAIERHCWIALYHYEFMADVIGYIDDVANAYVYTGDVKYGRAGAILLDRMADVWPEYDFVNFNTDGNRVFFNTDGGTPYGKIQGMINDCTYAWNNALHADAFYPMITDAAVINFLSEKAEKYELENDKTSSSKIWENWEKGILYEAFDSVREGTLDGNFGQIQQLLAATAIILDKEPDTEEIVKWIYKTGIKGDKNSVSGGSISNQLIDIIDRNGMGHEASPNYNKTQINGLSKVAEYLKDYKAEYNLYNNAKFRQMFMAYLPIVSVGSHHVHVGDSGSVADTEFILGLDTYAPHFKEFKDDPQMGKKIAQYIYMVNGYTAEGLNYGIFDENPEQMKADVLALIDENPEPVSEMMTGYGFSILRDGKNYTSTNSSTAKNNQRDFWIYYGINGGHGHPDTLNLGVEAYGLNLAPEMAYPPNTGADPNRLQWVSATISHNTVTVNDDNQAGFTTIVGEPLHFDDSGKVKVMDVDAPNAYTQTEKYRRTVVMIEATDDVSYGVDFFRVKGGNKHTFSFHAQSEKALPVEGLDFTTIRDSKGNYVTGAQVDESGNYIGTYAGVDTEYGEDPWTQPTWVYETKYPRGYTWMKNVRRDNSPEASFTVDFEITDYRKSVEDSRNLHLRLTQINDFTPDEVAIVGGNVPVKRANRLLPETLEYVLTQREGEDLDSLFTTVYQPYKETAYLESIVSVDVTTTETVKDDDVARAVKVTHTDGRVDYVVYATNNSVKYTVSDNGHKVFDFRGFVGVYSLNKDGNVIYRYVNDGDIIGESTIKPAAYTGEIKGFDRTLTTNNYIDVSVNCNDLSDVIGRHIYINNGGPQNAVYAIKGATPLENGNVRLDIGMTSLIKAHQDIMNTDAGYVYNISEQQKFSIPTSFVDDKAPTIDTVDENLSVSAGSTIKIALNAQSPIDGMNVEYAGSTLPRGASINTETGVITWKPTASQIGENHFAVTAIDSDGRENTVHFSVMVYGSTTGSPSQDNNVELPDTPSVDSSGESGSSGGGGGGGVTPAPDEEKVPSEDETEKAGNGDVSDNIRFTDLGNHAWAEDAIQELSSKGIIKGTSETTFSPQNNITRADFAILLVRAFELTSESIENFADVNASDYFASELAIARNTGLVGGIGDNKYAPRNTITRQDMMVIVYRALLKLGIELQSGDIAYSDYSEVSDYAKEAVNALVVNGLVNGKSNMLAPNDYTTRAEVAVLIKRILDFTNKQTEEK